MGYREETNVSRFAVAALLPEPPDEPTRADFVSREFDSFDEIADALRQLEAAHPRWRIISFVHSEDLPLLMEPPPGMTGR
jgi:hypothetical protein